MRLTREQERSIDDALVAAARAHAKREILGAHWDGCELAPGHWGCLLTKMADRIVAARERELAAIAITGKWCKRSEIMLAVGELTARELRIVQAVTRAIDRQVRAAIGATED